MIPGHRPLLNRAVNVSISASDDTDARGFPSWQVNRLTLQAAAALYGQGATVVFGHDWREDGVMEAVYGFARQVQPPVPFESDEDLSQPLLINVLPWPDKPRLLSSELDRLRSTLRVESAGLPADLGRLDEEAIAAGSESRLYKYVRARGLTHHRHRLDQLCDARICIGGRLAGAAGRYPGVVEEALLALRARKPLYIISLLGGAAAQLALAIEGRAMPQDFCRPTDINEIYAEPPTKEISDSTLQDRVVDRRKVWGEFAEVGIQGLAKLNRLTLEENKELLQTLVIDRVIELVLVSLSRLRAH